RRLGFLRTILDARMRKGLDAAPPAFAAILIVAATQILLMAAPAHAAVDSAVALARADSRIAGLSGLANALLRRIAAEKEEILAGFDPLANLPPWLAERWREHYGAERAAAM